MGFDQSSAFLAEVDKAAKEIAAEEAAEKKKKSPGTGSGSSTKSPSGSRSRAPQGSGGGKPTY
eukprot:3801571-Rhodomonas_salina.1